MKRIAFAVLVLSLALLTVAVLRSGDRGKSGSAARPAEVATAGPVELPSAALAAPIAVAEEAPSIEPLEPLPATSAREPAQVEPRPTSVVELLSAQQASVSFVSGESGLIVRPDQPLFIQGPRATHAQGVGQIRLLLQSPKPPPADGLHTEWHVEGEVRAAEGRIRNGKREGLWTEWHANDERAAEGRYFHGDRHGPWTHWSESGDVSGSGEYLYGEREGLWTDYRGGERFRVGPYRNGRAEGPTTWYLPGGGKREGSFSDDLEEGRFRSWYPNGEVESEGDFRYGKRQGRWRFYASDGTLDPERSGWYESGERQEE